jgi:hypothetical protein
MAISRPFLLALLGVALLGATVFAVQNARNSAAVEDTAVVAEQAPPAEETATPAAQPASSSGPEQLLQSALTADVESAAFDAELSFRSGGATNVIRATGAFVDNGAKEMPEARVQLHVRVKSMDLNEGGGFVTTGKRAWFTRAGTAYAVPQDIWGELVKAREKGTPAESTELDLDIDTDGWLSGVEEVGKEQVGGVQTTHIRAEVDSAKAITDIVKAMGETGEGALPLPNAEKRLRQSGLTNGDLHVWVGEDEIMRRVTLELSGRGDRNRRVDGRFSLGLEDVNAPQSIARPRKVETGLPGGVYGQFANGLLSGLANNAGLSPEELNIGAPVTNSHLKAERAVADNRMVVILFKNPRAFDDRAVADAVRAVDRRTGSGVAVLSDYLENVDRYGTLLEDLGVNQAPAVVVIGRNGEASLVEGYIDAESLTQVVADAR